MARVHVEPARLSRAFMSVQEAVQRHVLPAAVLAVADHKDVLRCEAFSSPLDPVATDSVFLLASITKPIMGVAMMQLVEDGLLNLGQPVAHYLPAFSSGNKSAITTWHLLTHTSGIPEIDWSITLRQRPEPAVSFQVACDLPLLFTPGSRFSYSTLSFYVLAELITRLSGLSYPDYLHQRIFVPLNMIDTSFDPRRVADRMVPVHGITADGSVSQREATDYFISLTMPGA